MGDKTFVKTKLKLIKKRINTLNLKDVRHRKPSSY